MIIDTDKLKKNIEDHYGAKVNKGLPDTHLALLDKERLRLKIEIYAVGTLAEQFGAKTNKSV